MKRKRTKATKSTEQQAAEEGWIYVYAPKTIRGWNSIWVEGSREDREEVEETARRLYIPAPTACGPRARANDAASEGESEDGHEPCDHDSVV